VLFHIRPDTGFAGYLKNIRPGYPARISGRIPDISVDKAQPFFAGWILELHNKWGLVTIFLLFFNYTH
jgi:hypothetical protein